MKLNLGGTETLSGGPGSPTLEGFVNVDIRDLLGVNVVCDIRNGLPAEWMGKVEIIRASHVIEHFHPDEVKDIVRYWASFLKEDGEIWLYCPNGELLARQFVNGEISCDVFSRQMFGNQDYHENLHRAAYDQERLCGLVRAADLHIISTNPRPNAFAYDIGVQAGKSVKTDNRETPLKRRLSLRERARMMRSVFTAQGQILKRLAKCFGPGGN